MRSSLEVRRRKDPVFWNTLNRILMVLVVVGACAVLVFQFYPELARRNEMSQNLERQKQDLDARQLLRKQREREVFLLENDKTYIETIARDKLDLMKEGETIYRFETPKQVQSGKTN